MKELIFSTIDNMALLVLIAYILTRSRLFTQVIVEQKINTKNTFILILIFSAFSIYGTMSGINFEGAVVSIRNLGPEIGGLIAGPIVGISVGLIGGLYRFFYAEGFTQVPCSIATLIAGLAGGLVFVFRKGKLISILGAVVFAIVIESIHLVMAGVYLNYTKPEFELMPFMKTVSLPILMTSTIGLGLFIFIFKNLVKERRNEQKKNLMESELKVANEIQMDSLPSRSAILSKTQLVDIAACLYSAKQVGGDLYDFFLLDDDHLCFLIGDVSDKGVPAALFMARSQSLLRSYTGFLWERRTEKFSPSRILQIVNYELNKENDNCMFLTLSYWVMNMKTGHLNYSVGGHNPPIIKRSDGEVGFQRSVTGPPLGINASAVYREGEEILKKDDLICLYTDGITEANNTSGEVYTEKRLLQTLKESSARNAESLIGDIIESVNNFTKASEQSDDITCLAVKCLKIN
jgi:sigma-B regulation protein RsbU (phosphoserine phosphatase)